MLQKLKCKLGYHRIVRRFEIGDDGWFTLIRVFCVRCKHQEWPDAGWSMDTGMHTAKEYIDVPRRGSASTIGTNT